MITQFQRRLLVGLTKFPNEQADIHSIAINVFPEKWTKPSGRAASGRAALVGHIDRAGIATKCIRLPPRGQYQVAVLCLSDEAKELLKESEVNP